jgi:hypothetical protein
MPILESARVFLANTRNFHSLGVKKGATGRRKTGGLGDKRELNVRCLRHGVCAWVLEFPIQSECPF